MRLLFDIEGNGLLDTITRVHCIVLQCADTGKTRRFRSHGGPGESIEDALAYLSEAAELIGHNIIDFDLPALKKVYPHFRYTGRVYDTLTIARLLWPDRYALIETDGRLGLPSNLRGAHKLAAWGHRLKEYKGDFGAHHEDEGAWAVWSQEMEDYCVQDVKVTAKLHRLLTSKKPSPESVELELRFRYLIHLQERHGFRFDVAGAQKLYAELAKLRLKIETDLQAIFPPRIETLKTPAYYFADINGQHYEAPTKGALEKLIRPIRSKSPIRPGPLRTKSHPFNPGSTDQIASRLIEKYNWKPTKFTDGGKPQVDEEALSGLTYPEVPPLLDYLKVKKIIGQVAEGDQAWLKAERAGRIHGSVNTNGAVTGRCTHSQPNVAQVPSVQTNKEGPIHGLPGGFGWECRSLFQADEGRTLVGFDASGLELRCLAHFMGRYDGGAYAKILLEGDIHTVNQQAAGLPTRNDAKTFIYAFLYGAGDAKIGSIVGGGSAQGKKLKEKFLRSLPALKRLKDAVQAAAKERGSLIGLDGRILPIRSAHAALNTLLQSAGALVMKKTLILLYDRLTELGLQYGSDYAFVANIHDEAQITCHPEHAELIGKTGTWAIAEAGKHFNFRCPLAGEYKIGPTWAHTH